MANITGVKYSVRVKMTGTGDKPATYKQLRFYFPDYFVVGYRGDSARAKMDFFSTNPDVLERSRNIVGRTGNLANEEVDAELLGPVEVDEVAIEEIMFCHKKSESANIALEEAVTLNVLQI